MAHPKWIEGEGGDVVLYADETRGHQLEVRLKGETLWLSLTQSATLFERDKSVISRHLRNVFTTGELEREATAAFFAPVQNEGSRTVEREVEHFNLDAILSVGYCVNSRRGTQFLLYRQDGSNRLPDNALVGLTLLVAESQPAENEKICAVIVNLINRENL